MEKSEAFLQESSHDAFGIKCYEEWNERSGHPSAISEDSMFLVQPTYQQQQQPPRATAKDLSLPRARRLLSGGSDSAPASSTNVPISPPGPPSDVNPSRRRRPEERQRSPSPGPAVGPLSPRERFQDAKEKFLLLERQRIEEQGRLVQKQRERMSSPRSPEQGPVPRSSAQRAPLPAPRGSHAMREREDWASEEEYEEDGMENYEDEEDEESERIRRLRARRPPPPPLHRLPSPPPDNDLDDSVDQDVFGSGGYFGPRRAPEYRRSRESLLDSPEEATKGRKYSPASHLQDKKRRSMFDVVEEERRRNSNELAKEFKRRSYHEPEVAEEGRRGRRSGNSYHELAEHERYPGLDRETARMQHHHAKAHRTPSEGGSGRYRHSYAEPEMFHRAGGRMGMAAINPY